MPATSETFKPFKNFYFIETGTYEGRGIEAALQAGFEQIISIEFMRKYVRLCQDRFAAYPNVRVVHGRSQKLLPGILADVDRPATFWLDAHYSGSTTKKDKQLTALEHELQTIAQHHISSHTILIDDRRSMGTKDFDFLTEERVSELLLAINPNYQIQYLDGYHAPSDTTYPHDIIAAVPPN